MREEDLASEVEAERFVMSLLTEWKDLCGIKLYWGVAQGDLMSH